MAANQARNPRRQRRNNDNPEISVIEDLSKDVGKPLHTKDGQVRGKFFDIF